MACFVYCLDGCNQENTIAFFRAFFYLFLSGLDATLTGLLGIKFVRQRGKQGMMKSRPPTQTSKRGS
ncbi:MAG TPA: hypothetical protein VI685_14220, partial [Candidatus Angelobacter sp.]